MCRKFLVKRRSQIRNNNKGSSTSGAVQTDENLQRQFSDKLNFYLENEGQGHGGNEIQCAGEYYHLQASPLQIFAQAHTVSEI